MSGALFAGRIPRWVPVERTAIAPLRRVSSLHSIIWQGQSHSAPLCAADSTRKTEVA